MSADQQLPSVEQLLSAYSENFCKAGSPGSLNEEQRARLGGIMADCGHAFELVEALSSGLSINRSPRDPASGRVLGAAAGHLMACGLIGPAQRMMNAAAEVSKEYETNKPGFATGVGR